MRLRCRPTEALSSSLSRISLGADAARLFLGAAGGFAQILDRRPLQEVIGRAPHQGDRDDLGEKGRRPEQARQSGLHTRLEVGLDDDRDQRPGGVSSDDQHRAQRKSPADLLSTECLFTGVLDGDLPKVVSGRMSMTGNDEIGFPRGRNEVPGSSLPEAMVTFTVLKRNT